MSKLTDDDYRSIQLIKSPEVEALMKERQIADFEVQLAIHHGESTGEKLYQEGSDRFLSKTVFSGVSFYVEYTLSDAGCIIHSTYAHMSEIL